MERRLTWTKSIEINKGFFEEMDNIYNIIGDVPKYIIDTEEGATYEFESTEEILKYNFDEEIEKLKIEGNNKRNDIKLILQIEVIKYKFSYMNYDYVCDIYYKITEQEKDCILKEKIDKLWKNHTKSDWWLGKIGIKSFLYLILAILVIYFFYKISVGNLKINTDSSVVEALIRLMFSGAITYLLFCIINFIDFIVCCKFFNPIVYDIGFQSKKYNELKQLRSNIFWGIIVSAILSAIFTLII